MSRKYNNIAIHVYICVGKKYSRMNCRMQYKKKKLHNKMEIKLIEVKFSYLYPSCTLNELQTETVGVRLACFL